MGECAPDLLVSGRSILSELGAFVKGNLLLAGDPSALCMNFLVAQTRHFGQPAGVIAYGASGSGKSYAQDLALRFVSPDAKVFMTDLSDKVLFRYEDDRLDGKCVVIGEGSAISDSSKVAYYLRKLFDDGEVVYHTNEDAGKGGKSNWRPVALKLKARIALFTSTTSHLDAENEGRMLPVFADDSDEMTKKVIALKAEREIRLSELGEPDYSLFRDADAYLEAFGVRDISVPFAGEIGKGFPTWYGPRARRDFDQLIMLVKAHAFWHQLSRETDENGRVVATPADYDAVRLVVEPQLAAAICSAVEPGVRAVVEAVTGLDSGTYDGVRVNQVIGKLQSRYSPATVKRLINKAVRHEYLENIGGSGRGPGTGKRYIPGIPLPTESLALPVLTESGRLPQRSETLDRRRRPR